MTEPRQGIYIHVQGHDIYTTLWMPEAPRKGDVLWLDSLTRGTVPGRAIVSEVAWAMDQASGIITLWIKVRRRNADPR